jgi:hypothetical protein
MLPLKAFISHRHEDVATASEVSAVLHKFGISGFLAHRDLEGGVVWLEGLKRAVADSDMLVAVLTPKFRESVWTDQEIGIGIGLGRPVIPISAGENPYGFFGHIQGVRWGSESQEGLDRRLDGTRLWSRAQRAERDTRVGRALILQGVLTHEGVLQSLEVSSSWDTTRVLMPLVGDLSKLTDEELISLAQASATNVDLNQCTEFAGAAPAVFAKRRHLFAPELALSLTKVGMLTD